MNYDIWTVCTVSTTEMIWQGGVDRVSVSKCAISWSALITRYKSWLFVQIPSFATVEHFSKPALGHIWMMIIHKRYSWSCHLYKWNPIGWEILKILKILPSFLEMNLIVLAFGIFCKRCCFVIFCSALLGPIHLAFGQNKLSTKDILKLQMWSDHWRKGSFKQKNISI